MLFKCIGVFMPRAFNPVAKQIIVPNDISLTSSVEKALIKLLDGTHGKHFEKLPPTKLYSMRSEDKGRIILIKSLNKGKPTLIVLEFLAEHEYHQSTFLHRLSHGQLLNRIQACSLGTPYILGEEGNLVTLKADPFIQPKRSFIEYGEHYLEASEAQQNAAFNQEDSSSAKIIFGEAGSGKTLVLMQRISSLASILATDETSTRKIWVIVPHLHLQRHLKDEWENHTHCKWLKSQNQTDPVSVVTPELFFRSLDAISDQIVCVDADYFLSWLSQEHLVKARQIFECVNPIQLYQELCILNGLNSIQGTLSDKNTPWYLKPNLNQAFLVSRNKADAHALLSRLLNEYQAHLNQNNVFDPNLYQPINAFPTLDYYFIDEAQNVSPTLLKAPNSVIAMNDSQSLLFKRRVNEILIQHIKKEHEFIELPGSHRSPRQQIALASMVDHLVTHFINPNSKHAITSKPLLTSNLNSGLLCFSEGCTEDELELLKQKVQEPDTAVVYLTDEGEAEFKRLGLLPLCEFNKKNPILGLEFKQVILVSPFSEDLVDVNNTVRAFKNSGISEELSLNRISELELFFNGLKAAITRSTETLVLVQKKTHKLEALHEFFNTVLFSPIQLSSLNDEDRQQALHQQATELYKQGQHEMASKILSYLNAELEHVEPLKELSPLNQSIEKKPLEVSTSPNPIRTETLSKTTLGKPQALNAIPTQESIVWNLSSLDPKLGTYVENLFKNFSVDNLEKLFTHPKNSERAAYIIFHHQMANGYCLFLNACFNSRIKILFELGNKNKEMASKLESAYSTIPEDDYFLRWVLSNEVNAINTPSKKSKAKTNTHPILLTLQEAQEKGFGYFFKEGTLNQQLAKVRYLINSITFFTEKDITHQYEYEEGKFAPSFLHILSIQEKEWEQFWKKNTHLSVERCFKTLFATENKQANALFILHLMMENRGSCKWIFERMHLIAPLLTSKLVCTPSQMQGVCPRSFLFYLSDDISGVLTKYWHYFKNFISKESLNTHFRINPEDEGFSAFSVLCSNSAGVELLINQSSDFIPHLDLDELFTPVKVEKTNKISSFHNLCCSAQGLMFLKKHWLYFKTLPEFTSYLDTYLFRDFPDFANPFFGMCGRKAGIELLQENWDDFLPHLNSSILNEIKCLPANSRDTSIYARTNAIYWLCANENGIDLIDKRWADIKPLLTKNSFLWTNVSGFEIGDNTFHELCLSQRGRAFLEKHWPDICHLISMKSLFLNYSAGQLSIKENARTPFSLLINTAEGRRILKLWNINPLDNQVPVAERVRIIELNNEKDIERLTTHGFFRESSKNQSNEDTSELSNNLPLSKTSGVEL